MIKTKLQLAAVAAGLLALLGPWGVVACVKIDALNDATKATAEVQALSLDNTKKDGLIKSLNTQIDGLNAQIELANRSALIEAGLVEQSRKLRSISDAIARDARSDPGLQGAIDPDLKRGLVGLDQRMRAQAAARTTAGAGDPRPAGDGADSPPALRGAYGH